MLARFVLSGAVAATVAWLLARGSPSRLAVEQRPMLGAIVSLFVYTEYAAVLGPPVSTAWALIASLGIGAWSGWLISVGSRISDETMWIDATDRGIWWRLWPAFGCWIIARALLFAVAHLRP